ALDFVFAGFDRLMGDSLGDDGGSNGFDGDGSERGLARFDHFRYPGDGAAGADAGDENVHFAVGVLPDFFGRGLAMDLGVGGVLKVLRDEGLVVLLEKFFGLVHRAAHAVGGGGEDDLGAQGFKESAAFERHGFGHGEDELVAFGGADKSQRNAGVAAGGLD